MDGSLQDTALNARRLDPGELTAETSNDAFPLVIEPGDAGQRALDAFLADNRDTVTTAWRKHGAILFRGFDAVDETGFDAVLRAAGLEPSVEYPFGISPRPNIKGAVYKSTQYTESLVIPPHTEMAYVRWRPAWISFLCQVPPKVHGETPLYDVVRALRELPQPIRERLQREPMRCTRHIRKKKAFITFERTIAETFNTEDRGEIDAAAAELGIETEWLPDGFLKAETILPAIVVHPETGEHCLNAQFINAQSLITGIRRIGSRYNPAVKAFFEWYIRKQFRKPTVHYRTRPVAGEDFTDAEYQQISETVNDCATLFRWREGDILLIDNIKVAHGRMNVKGERRILTALGDFFDLRTLQTVPAMARRGRREEDSEWDDAIAARRSTDPAKEDRGVA